MARTLGGRAGGRAAAATTATDELSQPIQAPSPRRAGIKCPVRETPHSDLSNNHVANNRNPMQ